MQKKRQTKFLWSMKEKKKKADSRYCGFKTSIGGSALIEGVMMKGPQKCAMSVRLPDGNIDTEYLNNTMLTKKYKWLNIPIVRGCFNFVETVVFSSKCLYKSAEKSGMEEEEQNKEPSKFEAWIDRVFGDKLFGLIISLGMVIGVVLALGLFLFLPMYLVKGLESMIAGISTSAFSFGLWKNVLEGVIKIGVFIAYLAGVSCMRDMRRVFEYHGAEHKTIACYEAGEALTPAHAKQFTRFHPRCGTSFLFIILILSILVSSFISWDVMWVRFLLKIAVLPVVVGLGYELIRLAGKHDNTVTRILSAPGLWMQRLTTKEPDEAQLEVAIAAMNAVIPENKNDGQWK